MRYGLVRTNIKWPHNGIANPSQEIKKSNLTNGNKN